MDWLSIAAGAVLVVLTLGSAIRSVVLPRGVRSNLSRVVLRAVMAIFGLLVRKGTSYKRIDALMARLAPGALALLAFVWVTLVMLGFTLIYHGIRVRPFSAALQLSASTITTLGFADREGLGIHILMFGEAVMGLFILALLITFLPSLYASFARRETMVAMLEVRAGSPPSVVEMIGRYHRIHGLDTLEEVWPQWEVWFAEIEESHSTFPWLPFFRSPQPHQSWITAAGAVLDAASFRASSIALKRDASAELCIRAGYLALRTIARLFDIPYDPNPSPSDPISVKREEFEEVWTRLEELGVPLKPDRDQAWRDFAGWRVNYDKVLLALSGLVVAPQAPWSSDRAHRHWRFSRTGGRPRPIDPDSGSGLSIPDSRAPKASGHKPGGSNRTDR